MTTRHLRSGLAAALFIALAAPALAQSADLHQWTAAGDVLVTGNGSAQLSTAAVDSGETPLSANSALQFVDLEPALALTGGTLAADTFEGSGLQQGFSAAAGSTVSFNWSLSTEGFDGTQADRAFVVIDGSTLAALGTVAASTVSGSFSHRFASAGGHSLAILVMDVDAYDRVSTLAVSGLAVSAVPEPGSWLLLLGGLAGVGAASRRSALRPLRQNAHVG